MTPFRFAREFQTTPEIYWRAFFDNECMRMQYELLAVRSYEVIEWNDTVDTLTRTTRVLPQSNLPAILRQVFGARMTYTETTVWHKRADYADTHVIPSTLASKTSIRARYTVRALDPERIERVLEGQIELRVPLFGARIERSLIAQMEANYEKTSEITSAWLARAREQ